jgi:hypothetical protein
MGLGAGGALVVVLIAAGLIYAADSHSSWPPSDAAVKRMLRFSLTFHRRYRDHGKARSVVSATCPAPPDLGHVPFKAARATFELADGEILTRTLAGSCRVAN